MAKELCPYCDRPYATDLASASLETCSPATCGSWKQSPGRPPLREGEGATALLRVRCREEQKTRWIEKAGGEGALSAWVCAVLDKAAR